jgi:uncharacterized protein YuzE
MTILYTKESNMLTIFFGSAEVQESIEHEPGLWLDLDKDGNVIGVEAHDAAGFLERAASSEGLELPEKIKRLVASK